MKQEMPWCQKPGVLVRAYNMLHTIHGVNYTVLLAGTWPSEVPCTRITRSI